jgi:hypothetical protein
MRPILNLNLFFSYCLFPPLFLSLIFPFVDDVLFAVKQQASLAYELTHRNILWLWKLWSLWYAILFRYILMLISFVSWMCNGNTHSKRKLIRSHTCEKGKSFLFVIRSAIPRKIIIFFFSFVSLNFHLCSCNESSFSLTYCSIYFLFFLTRTQIYWSLK